MHVYREVMGRPVVLNDELMANIRVTRERWAERVELCRDAEYHENMCKRHTAQFEKLQGILAEFPDTTASMWPFNRMRELIDEAVLGDYGLSLGPPETYDEPTSEISDSEAAQHSENDSEERLSEGKP